MDHMKICILSYSKKSIPAFVLLLSLLVSPFASADGNGHRERLEGLFLWKVADQLKLTSEEETKLAQAVKSSTKSKAQSLAKLESLSEKVKSRKLMSVDNESFLIEYEKALAEYSKCQLEEFNKIKKTLGPNRTVSYLALKHEFSERLREILSDSSVSEPSKPLVGDPKIIEDKK
jgi:hypothetical protein